MKHLALILKVYIFRFCIVLFIIFRNILRKKQIILKQIKIYVKIMIKFI